jgi:hypothetical protein
VYSAKINGEPVSFGTSGLLFRSNKLMYDRGTSTLWHQFTGEPVVGPLADSGIKLDFFPVELTTWSEWRIRHPDTTVLSNETGIYPSEVYAPEGDPRAIYTEYFASPDTLFPVWLRSDALPAKEVVLGLAVGDATKAYQIAALNEARVVNDDLGGQAVVVIASATSEAARVYERTPGVEFGLDPDNGSNVLPGSLVDSTGVRWTVTEDALIPEGGELGAGVTLTRLPTHQAFWFGWFQFYPDTELFRLPAD